MASGQTTDMINKKWPNYIFCKVKIKENVIPAPHFQILNSESG